MNSKILAAVKKYDLLQKGQSVTVALSGGADSVALLHCLHNMAGDLGIKLSAAHLNHGIRGEEADSDQAFCQAFCKGLGIELFEKKVDVPAECEATGESTELCARRLRYEFLEAIDTDLIATAHTASDNAETMLFNMARGGGIKAVCGIPAKRGRIIRPMLLVTRSEVEEYCRANSLAFVTDSTNLSDDYTRNYIRHNIVPEMKKVNVGFEENAAKMAELLRKDSEYLENIADKAYEELVEGDRLSLKVNDLPESIAARVVARFIEEHTNTRDAYHTEAVLELIKQGSGVVQLSGGLEAQAARGKLWVFSRKKAAEFEQPLLLGRNVADSGEITAEMISAEDLAKKSNVHKMLLNACIDCDKIVGKLVIRNRRCGDTLRANGRGVTKSLKNIFAESDIPFEKRGSIPMIADEKGLVWIPGQNVAERAAAHKSSKNILYISDYKLF